MSKTLFDIGCENFDLYFAREMELMTEDAKERLPRDISFKLFRQGGRWDSKSSSRLSFLAKLFVLLSSRKKRFFLVVEDEENGIGLDQFKNLQRNIKDRDYSVGAAEDGKMSGQMVLGTKELVNAYEYLNQLNTSPSYAYLLRGKNLPPNKFDQSDREMAYITKFLLFYETNKKAWVANLGLSIPEFYVLLCLYDGKEVISSKIHKEWLKRAYQSSPGRVKTAFGTLQSKKYVVKTGEKKGAKLQITTLGKQVLRETLSKYALNC